MNRLGRFGKGTDMVLRQVIDDIKRGQTVLLNGLDI
jgi:hypothetical protein